MPLGRGGVFRERGVPLGRGVCIMQGKKRLVI